MPSSSSFTVVFRETKHNTARRINDFLARRPHRSFQRTRRRDYVRSLQLPGYISFTHEVSKTVWQYRKQFGVIALMYFVLTVALIGIGSQQTYTTLTQTLQDTGAEIFEGNWGQLGQAGLLFASLATSGLTGTLTEAQQIYSAILVLMVWLTTVWLLRTVLAGHVVKARDAIYSAGAPVISTFIVGLMLVIQLLPLAIAVIAYSAANASGLLAGGIEAMLFWIAAGLLALLSLYWITSTFFALIIVTLPGMYPFRALRTAGDVVVGRRLRILLRIVWMTVVVALVWALLLIPVILLDGGIKQLWPAVEWLPIVPTALLILSTVSVIWSAAYIYVLYRKVVQDDAQPA